jgi:NAD(P)-dependent dehydrogenase (short-subunit alcohol dehydrogenase family)
MYAESADGKPLLHGAKSLAPGAAGADAFVVCARTGGGTLGLFLVEADAPGLTVDARTLYDGRHAASLVFEGVSGTLLADAGEAQMVQLIDHVMDRVAIAHCAETMGTMAQALDITQAPRFQAWLDSLGRLDIFVANVSALSGDWDAALHTDIRATVSTTEAAVPFLQRSPHGALTYIGSKAGALAAPNSAAYGAAKAAMAHYMKSLALRLLPGVRVNTVSPGDTLFEGGLWDRVCVQEPGTFEKVLQRNAMKRLATPEEIARVVAFVSSPAASFVAGANWYVDGGSVNHVQF